LRRSELALSARSRHLAISFDPPRSTKIDPCHVAARPGEAGNEADPDRVFRDDEETMGMVVDASGDVGPRNPTTGIATCCARTANGRAVPATPRMVMNSRRFVRSLAYLPMALTSDGY